jgi:hypothetical protein
MKEGLTAGQQAMIFACQHDVEVVWTLPWRGEVWLAIASEGVYLVGSLSHSIEGWEMYETRHEAVYALLNDKAA